MATLLLRLRSIKNAKASSNAPALRGGGFLGVGSLRLLHDVRTPARTQAGTPVDRGIWEMRRPGTALLRECLSDAQLLLDIHPGLIQII